MRILVVDDERAVREAIERALGFEGYRVDHAGDGVEALDALARNPVDAVVLDVLMPQMDGIELCRRIRASGDTTPILMLTARKTVSDRVAGLDAGADDYLVKPLRCVSCSPDSERSCAARSTRRAACSPMPTCRSIRRPARSSAAPAGSTSRTEFLLLELLLRNARRVLTREVIFEQVWGYDMDWNSNSLEVYIGYLRRKTEADGEPRLIRTVRGVGYVLREVA